MMRDPRRRSPESSSRRRRDSTRDSRHQQHLTTMSPEPVPEDYFQPPPIAPRRRAPSSSGSASSSASSLLDISRHYPQSKTSRWGGAIATFFRAPSERSRRTRKATRKRRILRLGNSSSSSLNSDLAYGTGYIARPRGHRGQSQRHHQRQDRGTADVPSRPGVGRARTDEEILDIGRRLSDFARRQNDHDLRAAGRSRPTGLVAAAAAATAAAAAASGSRRQKRHVTNGRGNSASRPHGVSSGDDSDWESASDDESSDAADSVLAYGSVASQAIRPGRPGIAASTAGGLSMHGGQSSVVDPRLFGPVNSLRGLVTPRPFGNDESSLPAVQYRNFNRLRRVETEPIYENAPMRDVHPVPTHDPTRFDAETAPRTPLRRSQTGPAPVPLQQPVPKAPVPSKVYGAEKLEDASRREWRQSRHHSQDHSFGGTAVAGIAAAAVGAALASDRRDRRDDKKREDKKSDERRRDDERLRSDRGPEKLEKTEKDTKPRDRESDRDKDRRRSKRESYPSSKHVDDKDQKKARHQEDERLPRKRRETLADHASEPGDARSRRGDTEPNRGSDNFQPRHRNERSNDERKDRRGFRGTDYGSSQRAGDEVHRHPERAPVDPYRRQKDDDALVTPKTPSERPLTPTVVTVDREPDFDNWSPKSTKPEPRLSRKDSFDIDRRASHEEKRDRATPRSDRNPDPDEQEAKEVRDEARHATVPIAAATVASAIAIARAQSRERRRRGENSNGDSRDRQERPEDAVQEQANRYYREVELARKIAGDQARSHSQDSERSVMDRWEKNGAADEPTIVTPPEAEDREWRKDEGPYRPPDADVRIDNKIYPREIDRFRLSSSEWGGVPFKSRDPSCERERPVLNLVYPTPDSSRYASPSPEQTKGRHEDQEQAKRPAQPELVSVAVDRPKDESMHPSTPKSVSWGENSTKRFEVESPESRGERVRDVGGSGARSRPILDGSSQWGIMAAAMVGSSTESDNEPGPRDWERTSDSKHRSGAEERPSEEPTAAPPRPGPKPVGPELGQMPGGFADDMEFAATLAAGLKDTGFDPNIVIDDPLYHRRSSPPGKSESNGDGWIGKDGSVAGGRSVSEPGFVIGEVETPREESSRASVAGEWAEAPAKLSKKEKKRLEKLKRQSSEMSEPATAEALTASTFDLAGSASRRGSALEQRKHDSSASRHGDDNYAKAEAERGQGSTISPDAWEEGARSKQKKNRRSRDVEDDTHSKVSVPTDAFDDLQSLRKESVDDDCDASKKLRRSSKRNSDAYDSRARSSAPSEVSEASSGRRSSKSKRSSGNEFFNSGDEPPGRSKRSPFEDHEVSSVVSESRYNKQKRDKREGKRSSRNYDDDDDAKSIASAPGSSRKSKDSGKKSGGLFSSIFKPGGSRDEQKKGSFLDDAGTSGEGVGLASIAAVATAGFVRAHATGSSSEMEHAPLEATEDARDVEALDPEVAPRAIKPAIDPQYGDLLPLPPSEPGSPRQPLAELPGLPESRPSTPPDQRDRKREHETRRRSRSTQETPVKSHSSTAIPISLRLGQRGTPTPPSSSTFKSPPPGSPVGTPSTTMKRQARRISWDSSRAIMPLYLLEHSRHRSADSVPRQSGLPVLPPSGPPSRETSTPELIPVEDASEILECGLSAQSLADVGLRIDTGLASAAGDHDIAGSQETTPRAEARPELPSSPPSGSGDGEQDKYVEPDPVEPTSKDRSSFLLHSAPCSIESNRTADRERPAQSSCPSSSTGELRMANASPNVSEDLTSADEHFSDALEGQSEDGFEEALASPARPFAIEQQTGEQQDKVTAAFTTVTTETEDAEPDEWRTMSAKERKKAWKSRKKEGLDMASVAAAAVTTLGAAAAAAAGSVLGGGSTHSQDGVTNRLETSNDVLEQPTKGKKGKTSKKKKKLPGWDHTGETPAESGKDASLAASQPKTPEDAAAEGFSPTKERETSTPTTSLGAEEGIPTAAFPDKATKAGTATEGGNVSGAVEGDSTADQAPSADFESALKSSESSDDKREQDEAGKVVEPGEAPAPESKVPGYDELKMTDQSRDIGPQKVLEQPPPSAEPGALQNQPEMMLPGNNDSALEVAPDDPWSSPASSRKGRKKNKKDKAASMDKEGLRPIEARSTLPSEDVAADQAHDKLEPGNMASDVAKEDIKEPEAEHLATQLLESADHGRAEANPVAVHKKDTATRKGLEATPQDEAQEPRNESLASPGTPLEPSFVDEPPHVGQTHSATNVASPGTPLEPSFVDEPPHVGQTHSATAVAAVVEDEPAATSALDTSTVDTEAMWATPTISKKDKKARKKKDQRMNDTLRMENSGATVSVADKTPFQTAANTECQHVEPVSGGSASAVFETDSAPATQSQGKKKKSKRRSMLSKADEPEAARQTQEDDADLSTDPTLKDPAATDLQTSVKPETSTADKTEDAENLPSSALDAAVEGPLAEDASSSHDPLPLSATASDPAASASVAVTDQKPSSQEDALEQIEGKEVVFTDAPQTVQEEDIALDVGQKDIPLDASRQQQDSELIISEPLFSQEGPLCKPSQAPTQLESTQASESIVSEPPLSLDEAPAEPSRDPTYPESS